jgi:phosphatidylcholine synthase
VFFAWSAHLYTALGAVLAFLATTAVFVGDYREAFLWLSAQVFVDATDGLLARRARVHERLPWFNGAKLDDIVDYLTYVFVPALIVWRALMVPDSLLLALPALMLLSSAYGFNRDDAKTADHFFTGFPSYWNIVVLYLLLAGWTVTTNAVILTACVVLVFVPIRYLYPSRTPILRLPTNVLGGLWGVSMLVMLWMYPNHPPALLWASLLFPVYYVVLSLVLQSRTSV